MWAYARSQWLTGREWLTVLLTPFGQASCKDCFGCPEASHNLTTESLSVKSVHRTFFTSLSRNDSGRGVYRPSKGLSEVCAATKLCFVRIWVTDVTSYGLPQLLPYGALRNDLKKKGLWRQVQWHVKREGWDAKTRKGRKLKNLPLSFFACKGVKNVVYWSCY